MKRVKKERPYPDKVIIKGALRRVMARSPMIKLVMDAAVHPNKKGIRGGKQFICSICTEAFPANQVAVDHCDPVVPVNRSLELMTYDEMVARIFCSKENLQVVCEICHKAKTKKEREHRKLFKDAMKDADEVLAEFQPVIKW